MKDAFALLAACFMQVSSLLCSSVLKMEAICSPKLRFPFIWLQDVRSQKTELFIVITMRTSNPTQYNKFFLSLFSVHILYFLYTSWEIVQKSLLPERYDFIFLKRPHLWHGNITPTKGWCKERRETYCVHVVNSPRTVLAYFMNEVKSCKGLMDAFCKSQERTVPACTAWCCDVRIVTPVSWTPPLTLFSLPPSSPHLNGK
jgi:hypothetical protein